MAVNNAVRAKAKICVVLVTGAGDAVRPTGRLSAARRHEVSCGRARVHDPHATLLVIVRQAS